MYGVTVVTPPATRPITAAQLRARLRLNDAGEDGELEEMIDAAVEQFELDACRPVLATLYRQDLTRWPACTPIILGRGGVTAVSAVKKYDAAGASAEIGTTLWRADVVTPPARVYLSAIPDLVTTSTGVTVSPVGCVEFTAGWASAAAVPKLVLTALKLLAAHYYEHREAFQDGTLTELPMGWWNVVAKFKLGISGDWGQ